MDFLNLSLVIQTPLIITLTHTCQTGSCFQFDLLEANSRDVSFVGCSHLVVKGCIEVLDHVHSQGRGVCFWGENRLRTHNVKACCSWANALLLHLSQFLSF